MTDPLRRPDPTEAARAAGLWRVAARNAVGRHFAVRFVVAALLFFVFVPIFVLPVVGLFLPAPVGVFLSDVWPLLAVALTLAVGVKALAHPPADAVAAQPSPDAWLYMANPATAPAAAPLDADLGALEAERAAMRRRMRGGFAFAPVAGFGLAALLSGWASGASLGQFVVVGLVLSAFAAAGVILLASRGYEKRFKREVIARVAARDGFVHAGDATPDVAPLVAAGILPDVALRVWPRDGFSGRRSGFDVRLDELNVQRRGSKSSFSLFTGLLVTVRLPRPAPGRLVMRGRDDDPRGDPPALPLRPTGDPEFDAVCDVFADDGELAGAVLTPDSRRALLALGAGTFRLPAHVTIDGSGLCLALRTASGGELFEPMVLGSATAADHAAAAAAEFAEALLAADAALALAAAVRRAEAPSTPDRPHWPAGTSQPR